MGMFSRCKRQLNQNPEKTTAYANNVVSEQPVQKFKLVRGFAVHTLALSGCLQVLKGLGGILQHTITKTRLFKYIENSTTKKKTTTEFSDKNSSIFHISAQNIGCGYSLEPPRRGGSNEYPQSMFLSRNKKNNIYPCKPQFYYIKVGFKEVNII